MRVAVLPRPTHDSHMTPPELESKRLQQATRNEAIASLLRRLSVEGIF